MTSLPPFAYIAGLPRQDVSDSESAEGTGAASAGTLQSVVDAVFPERHVEEAEHFMHCRGYGGFGTDWYCFSCQLMDGRHQPEKFVWGGYAAVAHGRTMDLCDTSAPSPTPASSATLD